MPELSEHMAYGGPGTAMTGPVVGALVPFILGPFTTAAAANTGTAEVGFRAPCDFVVESISWAAMTYGGATSTLAAFKHTDVNGAIGGTALMAVQPLTATGNIEGSSLSSLAARKFTKGQYLVFDPVIVNSAAANLVITVMAYITGHAVADKAVRS